MAPKLQTVAFTDSSSASLDALESRIAAHLPYSLPLLRRVQFARYRDSRTEQSRVVIVSRDTAAASGGNGNGVKAEAEGKFTAAYVDVSGGPDTQMWLFSTLETELEESISSVEGEYVTQLRLLTEEIVHLAKAYGKDLVYPGNLLLGTLHSRVKGLLERTGRVTPRETGIYDKWLFGTEDLPTYSSSSGGAAAEEDSVLGEGMKWDTATDADLDIVISRTDIPRTPKTLRLLPSLVIRAEDGTPAAWAFLGLDGSLTSLHCEPQYRRRGLAKTLASRLMRQGPGLFARDDGWSSADVSPGNEGSRGMCRSLGGVPRWQVSWVLFDVTEHGGDETVGSES